MKTASTAERIGGFVGATVALLICFGAYAWWQNSETPNPPSVIINDTFKNDGVLKNGIVSFGQWTLDGSILRSNMTLNGSRSVIDGITFSAFDYDDVKINDGEVSYPSLRQGETGRAEIILTDPVRTEKVVISVE